MKERLIREYSSRMSSTQDEKLDSRRSKTIGGIVAGVVALGLFAGSVAFVSNVRANEAAHTQLMAGVKIDGRELGAAAQEDAEVAASAVQATQINHINAVAAEQTAARVAAEQAAAAAAAQAAAEAAARQAAADRAARPQATTQTVPGGATGPIKCPAGSQANSGDGPNDTSCLPEICFHIQLPDPAHPDCETPFKP